MSQYIARMKCDMIFLMYIQLDARGAFLCLQVTDQQIN